MPRPSPGTIDRHERRLCLALNRWAARAAVVRLFRLASRLGDGVAWYVLMLLLVLLGGRSGLHAALHMVAIGTVSALLYRSLKQWTRRPRPFRAHADIVAYVAPLDEFSFPSGHTLHASGFTCVAVAWFPALAPGLVPFALLVAVSRIVLGVHYPSDVLAAAVLGIGLAGASFALLPA